MPVFLSLSSYQTTTVTNPLQVKVVDSPSQPASSGTYPKLLIRNPTINSLPFVLRVSSGAWPEFWNRRDNKKKRTNQSTAHKMEARAKHTLTASMYTSVITQCSLFMFFPWIANAKSLVITPSSSMTSMQAASRSKQKARRGVLSSSLARWSNPRVQAKIEATGFVEVSFPFCHSR